MIVRLNDLSPAEGSTKARKRVGRGQGSGTAKTCGYGHKGQKARSGVSPDQTGGQTPLYRTLPKRGFTPPDRNVEEVTTYNVSQALQAGKLKIKEGEGITLDDLKRARLVPRSCKKCRIVVRRSNAEELIKIRLGPNIYFTGKKRGGVVSNSLGQ